MDGDPRIRPTNPDAVESTINVSDFPSPLKMSRELLLVEAPNATVPAELIDTPALNEFKLSLVDEMVASASMPSRALNTPGYCS